MTKLALEIQLRQQQQAVFSSSQTTYYLLVLSLHTINFVLEKG